MTANGTLITLNVPGAVSTEIFGFNDSHQIVGDYTDANGTSHGFFAAPAPEPSAWTTLGIGACTLVALTARRRRLTRCL